MTKQTDKGAPVANGRAPVAAPNGSAVEPALGVAFCGHGRGRGGGFFHSGSDRQLKRHGADLVLLLIM